MVITQTHMYILC